jgi:hypothetical protein
MTQIRTLLSQSTELAAKEQLEFLLTAAKAKLLNFENEINDMYRYPEKLANIQIFGDRSVASYKEYRANISVGVDAAIGSIIDDFFGATTESIKSGFVTLIKKGLSTILGNETAGESEQHFFAVVPNGLVITRLDVKVWRYNYSSDGIIAKVKNAFCFYTSLATVDNTKLSKTELVFFIQQIVGNDIAKVKDFIEKLTELWDYLEHKSVEETHETHIEQMASLTR